MKIGIISDTHDRLDAIERAVEVFNEARVEFVIHAGDFVSPFTERPFRALNAKFCGIFGNNDGDKLLLNAKYREKGVGEIREEPLELEIQSAKIVVTHKPKLVSALSSSGIYDIVIYGHTHVPEVRKTGGNAEVLIVNPGECCGYLSNRKTVAIIDLNTFSADIIEI